MENCATPPTCCLRATSCMEVVTSTPVCPLGPGVQSPTAHSCHHRSASWTAPSVPVCSASVHLMRTHAAAPCMPTWQWGQGTAQLHGECTAPIWWRLGPGCAATQTLQHSMVVTSLIDIWRPRGAEMQQHPACLPAVRAVQPHTCSKAQCAHLLVFGRSQPDRRSSAQQLRGSLGGGQPSCNCQPPFHHEASHAQVSQVVAQVGGHAQRGQPGQLSRAEGWQLGLRGSQRSAAQAGMPPVECSALVGQVDYLQQGWRQDGESSKAWLGSHSAQHGVALVSLRA